MKLATVRALRPNRPQEAPEGDDSLMRRLADGDVSALGVLYDRHHDGVRQFVTRAMAGGTDADDVTQEAFLTLSKVAARFDGRESARPFLLGIATQLVRRRRRGFGRWMRALSSLATAEEMTSEAPRTPEDAMSGAEQMRRFDRALSRLSEDKRITLLLVEREGLTGPEAAKALDIPVNTVWTRLHHARAELRRALGQVG